MLCKLISLHSNHPQNYSSYATPQYHTNLRFEWGYLFLSPRIANRIKAHRGDIHHVNSTHPISLLPRLRAILAGIIIQKNMAIANPTISANEFNMCSNMLMYLYHMKLCVVLGIIFSFLFSHT